MSKFTVSIPDDLLADAKSLAANSGTSLSEIVRLLLDGFVANGATALAGNHEILLKYSLGKLSAAEASKALHLDTANELHTLTLQAGFPLPRLSRQDEDAMQQRFSKMLDRCTPAPKPATSSKHSKPA